MSEPIAVVGAAVELPGIVSLESFWTFLEAGACSVKEWDRKITGVRWASRFDELPDDGPDPLQQLLLTTSQRALRHAGVGLNSSGVGGMFIGASNLDSEFWREEEMKDLRPLVSPPRPLSSACGYVSHNLGMQGPSLLVDTSCSSSLAATLLACRSLKEEECSFAVVCSANLLPSPGVALAYERRSYLAADGRAKIYSQDADGYVLGEGAVAIVLQPFQVALQEGREILGLLFGGALNHNGGGVGLEAPRGVAQKSLIRKALTRTQTNPKEISYVESSAVGQPFVDAVEAHSVGVSLSSGNDGEGLRVGSIKGNVGNLGAASGLMGLVKVLQMMDHRKLVPQPWLKTPTSQISWERLGLQPVLSLQDWVQTDSKPLKASLHVCGNYGSNVHLVIGSYDS